MCRLITALMILVAVVSVAPGSAQAQVDEPPQSAQPAAASDVEPTAPAEPTIDALTAELQAREPERRLAAVRALGERRDGAAIAALLVTLRSDPLPEIRIEAAQVLARQGAQVLDALRNAAHSDANAQVRRIAGTLAQQMAPASEATEAMEGCGDCPDDSEALARASRRMRISGWVVFGLASLGTFMEGIFLMLDWWDPEIGWMAMIPIIGPVMALSTGELEGMGVVNVVALLAQVGGMAVALVGQRLRHPERGRITRLGRRRAPQDEGRRRRSNRGVGVTVAPMGSGLALAGWFR